VLRKSGIIERTGLVAAVEHDVTGRRAEEDAQRFLAAIVESSEDPIVACTPALPGTSASAEAAPVFDREGFVERLMGDEDLAQRIIRGFVGDMPRQIALLAQAVNNLDSKAVRLVAHSIKGAAASVGGLEIREMAWKLEQTGRAGDFAAATAVLPELSASFERARPAMERFCRQDPGV
jgi:HPt (histidine-containing phosphotransfer) domain-containing protein